MFLHKIKIYMNLWNKIFVLGIFFNIFLFRKNSFCLIRFHLSLSYNYFFLTMLHFWEMLLSGWFLGKLKQVYFLRGGNFWNKTYFWMGLILWASWNFLLGLILWLGIVFRKTQYLYALEKNARSNKPILAYQKAHCC